MLFVALYLQAVCLEDDVVNHGVAGFAMASSWTGEYKLGKIDGAYTHAKTKINKPATGDRASIFKWLSPHPLAPLQAADYFPFL